MQAGDTLKVKLEAGVWALVPDDINTKRPSKLTNLFGLRFNKKFTNEWDSFLFFEEIIILSIRIEEM